MHVNAYAKINWSLDTVGTRADGYHLLDMIMQSITLHDDVILEAADALTLRVDGSVRVTASADNLALRAAEALRRHAGVALGADIRLHKRIPVGAGLGGGSSDAAAVLHGLNQLWQLHYPLQTLCEIGLSLGADIPYCLHGGLCRAQGIGEILTPLPISRVYHLVVIQPCRALSTKQVFTSLEAYAAGHRPHTDEVAKALQAGNLTALAAAMGNTLQGVSEALRPPIRQAIISLREHGARAAQMTGSGSAVFGVFTSAAAAQTACAALRKKYRVCHVASTLSAGW